jgi:hypothetical protein
MLLGSGEQGFNFNGFVAQNDERCHGSGPLGDGFVSYGIADAADDLFAPELFQIIGSTTWPVLGLVLLTQCTCSANWDPPSTQTPPQTPQVVRQKAQRPPHLVRAQPMAREAGHLYGLLASLIHCSTVPRFF